MFTAVSDVSGWAVARFGITGWLVWAAAVSGVAYGGACLRPWARCYTVRLAQGALPDAATLWGSAATAVAGAGCHLRLAMADRAWGLLWAAAAGAVLAFWGMTALPGLLLCLCLAALAWLDARSGLLPDALTAPMMVAGWLFGPLSVATASSASALVWASLAALAGGYRWLRGRDGFGAGDVKCLAALAAWLGVEGTASVLCQACVLGVCLWGTRRGLAWLQAWPHCRLQRWCQSRAQSQPQLHLYSFPCASPQPQPQSLPPPPAPGAPFGPCIALAAVPAILGLPALQSWF